MTVKHTINFNIGHKNVLRLTYLIQVKFTRKDEEKKRCSYMIIFHYDCLLNNIPYRQIIYSVSYVKPKPHPQPSLKYGKK
jgi:hypothetical protein